MRRATLALMLLFAVGCARVVGRGVESRAVPDTSPERLQEFLASRRDPGVSANPRIRPGDVIRIDVTDVEEASREYTVARNGKVRLPLIGETKVGGKSVEEAGDEIARRMETFVVKPAVVVKLVDQAGGEATVEGAVERPGRIRLGLTGKTLLEALSAAGGLTPDASGMIRITPGSSAPPGLLAEPPGGTEEPIELAADDVLRGGANGPVRLYLRPGDRIDVVSKSGAIASAGPDPLTELGLASAEPLDAELAETARGAREPAKPEPRSLPARGSTEARREPEPESAESKVAARERIVERPAPKARREPEAESVQPKVATRERIIERPVPAARPERPPPREPAPESVAVRSELDALRRRVEANEVELRNQVRRAEDESAKQRREAEIARAEAEDARKRMAAERERAEALTARIAEIEGRRGGTTIAAERPSSSSPTETVFLREQAATTTEGRERGGGLFSFFGGGADDEEEFPEVEASAAAPRAPAPVYVPPAAPRIVGAPPAAPPTRELARTAPPPAAPPPAARPVPAAPPAAAPPRVVASAPPRAAAPAASASARPPAPPAVPPANARIGVMGRVQNQGTQLLSDARTVTRAVARAGIAPDADVSRIEVRRGSGNEGWRIFVNLREVRAGRSPDVVLEDGDAIFVP